MIEVEVTYDDADYQRAIKFMSQRPLRIGYFVLAIGGLVLTTFYYLAGAGAGIEWWVIPGLFLMIAVLFAVTAWSQRWTIGRQLRKIPDSRGPYVWKIDAEGIQITGALSNSSSKWAALTKVRETQRDFYFYSAPKFARFLPKRVFADTAQVSGLRHLITEAMPGKAKLLDD